jgi:HAD superfamily hydrolase (TIGR01484 family)
MKQLKDFPKHPCKEIAYVLCDLDDTLTLDGRLPAASYGALERLFDNGRQVVVVTGRPGGWCDMIARFWPICGVVGENGAFYFKYDHENRRMIRRFQQEADERRQKMTKLKELYEALEADFPGFAISADQTYRECDLAIDFCEDVAPVPMAQVLELRDALAAGGATVKVSSIHLNAWFGTYSKLEMTKTFFHDELGLDLEAERAKAVYVGDSPNDEPMFEFFTHSIGVANVREFVDQMTHPPRWITQEPGGFGFEEISELLLANG